MRRPYIVGVGGTPKAQSTTELALAIALKSAEALGAETTMFAGDYLASLPLYLTPGSERAGGELLEAVRRADGIILASPGYHGSISGALKNAIDYFEALSKDERVYLDSLPVGLIVTAFGWQATGSTLASLRSIVHALRGWPTPLGATINTAAGVFENGVCIDEASNHQLAMVGEQVAWFAARRGELGVSAA